RPEVAGVSESLRPSPWCCSAHSVWPLVECCVDDGPKMNDPPHPDPPENGGRHEHDQGANQLPLQKLSEPRNKETRQRGDDVARRARRGHNHGPDTRYLQLFAAIAQRQASLPADCEFMVPSVGSPLANASFS